MRHPRRTGTAAGRAPPRGSRTPGRASRRAAQGGDGTGVVVGDEAADDGAVERARLLAGRGEREADPAEVGDLVRHPHQGAARAVLLDAPVLPAAARQSVRDHPQVAELARDAEAAAEQAVVGDDRAADTRADRQHHHVRDETAGAEPELGPAGRVRIVLHHDLQPEARLESLPEGLVPPPDVRRVVDDGLLASTNPAAATPTGSVRPSARRAIICATASSSACGSVASVGMRALVTIPPNSSTTAPAILVPPMSMPIACTSAA